MRGQKPAKASSAAPKGAQQEEPAAVDDAVPEQEDEAQNMPHRDLIAEALAETEAAIGDRTLHCTLPMSLLYPSHYMCHCDTAACHIRDNISSYDPIRAN